MKDVVRYLACGGGVLALAVAACGGGTSSQGFSPEAGTGDQNDGGTVPLLDATSDVPSIISSFDAPPACVGLACNQVSCPGGGTTSISGTVYAPNGTLPLYNVIVYVPNAPLEPLTQGITCDQCGSIASGNPLVTALTDSSGKFVLNNVPVGTNIPLVVQLGKWRRQTTISTVTACTNTPLTDPELTRLPKNQKEGSMPHIALTTGSCDSMGCMLGKLGIDPAEFGVQTDGFNKAINVYTSAGDEGATDGFTNTTPAGSLWGDLTLLKTYDLGIFSCECDEALTAKGVPASQIDPVSGLPTSLPASADFANVTDYLNAGGRIFTTDFQYTWYRYSPDPQLGAAAASDLNDIGIGVIPGGAPPGNDPLFLNETFPKGLALAQWLTAVFPSTPVVSPDGGVLPNASVTCDSVWDNITSINAKPQLWATADSTPHVFTVNTPVGVPTAQQCGKGVHIDAHITESEQGSPDFVGCNDSGPVGSPGCYPLTCTQPLKQDEAMFAFFFFDLASCIQNEGSTPVPPPPPK